MNCATQLAARVASNDDWLKECKNKHRIVELENAGFARQTRVSARLTLREVARRMGISAMHLSDLERGNRHWTQETVAAWGKALQREKAMP